MTDDDWTIRVLEKLRKLANAGYLKKAYVSKDAYWEFNFEGDNKRILAAVMRFFRETHYSISKKEIRLLGWMLENTNSEGQCAGSDHE